MLFVLWFVTRSRAFGVLCALLVVLIAPGAGATPAGFAEAEAAWAQGDLEAAQRAYEEALEEGGLAPPDVLLAYTRIGTVKAALGDDEGALSAFRVAAAIDQAFVLPTDAGPQANKLYQRALAEAVQQGDVLSLDVTAPDSTAAGEPFSIETRIPEGFAVLVDKVVITIEDPVTGKKWRKSLNSEPGLVFQFPARVALAGAQLEVRAAAVDGQKNEWVASTTKIKVDGTRKSFDWGEEEEIPAEDEATPKKDDEGGGFFAGPLPWIIGGAVVVGGIVLFAVTRSSDQVQVGAPTWQ